MKRAELILSGVWWTIIGVALIVSAPVFLGFNVMSSVLVGVSAILCGWLSRSHIQIIVALSNVLMTLYTIGLGFFVTAIVVVCYPEKWLAIALIAFELITIVICVRSVYNQLSELWNTEKV